jgi:cytochrome oxidase assembly protein ShyY1
MLKLALTARWIITLILCLALSGVFAYLAQWQIERSFLPDSGADYYTKTSYQVLDDITAPGQPYTFQEVTTEGKDKVLNLAIARVKFMPQEAVLVDNRVQLDGTEGYWVVVPATSEKGRLFVVVGFVANKEQAQNALVEVRKSITPQSFTPIDGRYLPTEAPLGESNGDIYGSMSIAQLVNSVNWSDNTNSVYPGFLAITKENRFTSVKHVDPLSIGLAKSPGSVNWLSLFYALEWTAFALFAVFMWWRLLADAYKKQQRELLALDA